MTLNAISSCRKMLIVVALVVGLVPAVGWAEAQTCTAEDRANFAALIESGDADDTLQAQIEADFGHCRFDPEGTSNLRLELADDIKTVTNTGAVFYEQLNSCGYHPQAEQVSCDVQLSQTFGFGGFPGGSTEWVIFCFDCNLDGVFEYNTFGSVHVTDDVSGAQPGYFFEAHSTTFDAPAQCTTNDGLSTNVRAILSWVQRPTGCNFQPVWGNQIDFTARRDP